MILTRIKSFLRELKFAVLVEYRPYVYPHMKLNIYSLEEFRYIVQLYVTKGYSSITARLFYISG